MNLFNWISIHLESCVPGREWDGKWTKWMFAVLAPHPPRLNLILLITIDWFDITVRLMRWCTRVGRRWDVGQGRSGRLDVLGRAWFVLAFHVRDGVGAVVRDLLLGQPLLLPKLGAPVLEPDLCAENAKSDFSLIWFDCENLIKALSGTSIGTSGAVSVWWDWAAMCNSKKTAQPLEI